MQEMLHIAWDNIKVAHDRACLYVYHNRYPHALNLSKNTLLRVPPNAQSSIYKCAKMLLWTFDTPIVSIISYAFFIISLIHISQTLIKILPTSYKVIMTFHQNHILHKVIDGI